MPVKNKVLDHREKWQIQTERGKFVVYKLDPEGEFDSRDDAFSYVDGLLKPKPQPQSQPEPSSEAVIGWHFIDRDRMLIHGDGRLVEVGETIHVDPPIVPMKNGLLVSTKPILALKFGRRAVACRVKGWGEVVGGQDGQYAVSDRTCLWMADAVITVIQWGGWCAMRALSFVQENGIEVNPASFEAAQLAMNYDGNQNSNVMQVCMGASQASFAFGSDPRLSAAATAAYMVAQAVSSDSMSKAFKQPAGGGFPGGFPSLPGGFPSGGFPSLPSGGFPSFPGGFPSLPQGSPGGLPGAFPGFPSFPSGGFPGFGSKADNNVGTADMASSTCERAAETASNAFPEPTLERDVQNQELENRLLQLAPPDAIS